MFARLSFGQVIVVVVKSTESILVAQNYLNKFGPILSFSFSFVELSHLEICAITWLKICTRPLGRKTLGARLIGQNI